MMVRWDTRIVELLLAEREAGEVDFARAWRHAANMCRAEGVERPRDYYERGRDEDPDWLPYSTFFRRACEREWAGVERVDYIGLRMQLREAQPAPAGVGVPGSRRVVLIA